MGGTNHPQMVGLLWFINMFYFFIVYYDKEFAIFTNTFSWTLFETWSHSMQSLHLASPDICFLLGLYSNCPKRRSKLQKSHGEFHGVSWRKQAKAGFVSWSFPGFSSGAPIKTPSPIKTQPKSSLYIIYPKLNPGEICREMLIKISLNPIKCPKNTTIKSPLKMHIRITHMFSESNGITWTSHENQQLQVAAVALAPLWDLGLVTDTSWGCDGQFMGFSSDFMVNSWNFHGIHVK